MMDNLKWYSKISSAYSSLFEIERYMKTITEDDFPPITKRPSLCLPLADIGHLIEQLQKPRIMQPGLSRIEEDGPTKEPLLCREYVPIVTEKLEQIEYKVRSLGFYISSIIDSANRIHVENLNSDKDVAVNPKAENREPKSIIADLRTLEILIDLELARLKEVSEKLDSLV